MSAKGSLGYTLTETLVALGIVSVVAAVTFPIVVSAKRSGKVAKTIQNLKNLHAGALIYQSENNGADVGTPEAMGLPLAEGTIVPYPNSLIYLKDWYRGMKSPFGEPGKDFYSTFLIPSKDDKLPFTWKRCTEAAGSKCIIYYDGFEPGKDPRTGWNLTFVDHVVKRLHGISLNESLVTHEGKGLPLSQAWWIPELQRRRVE